MGRWAVVGAPSTLSGDHHRVAAKFSHAWADTFRDDFGAPVVVALVALPLCVGVAVLVHAAVGAYGLPALGVLVSRPDWCIWARGCSGSGGGSG